MWTPDDVSNRPLMFERRKRLKNRIDRRLKLINGHVEAELQLSQSRKGILQKDVPSMATRRKDKDNQFSLALSTPFPTLT